MRFGRGQDVVIYKTLIISNLSPLKCRKLYENYAISILLQNEV